MFDYEKKSKVEAVTETALTYQLLSQYTAFVAVSEEVRVEPGGQRVSVEVPVEMPEGVSYEGIFGGVPDQLQRRRGGLSMSRLSAPMARGGESVKSLQGNYAATDWMSQEAERGITFGGVADWAVRKVKKALSKGSSPDQATNRLLEVIAVVGLDNAGQDALARYLKNVELPPGVSGEIILELWVKGDRVVRVVVDDENTSLTDKQTLEATRRSLLQWRLTVPCAEKIEVVLAIAP